MLRKLSISNYAIIEYLELLFSDRLTVITGETGAGKSIAIEALSLVLGERAEVSVLYDKNKKCIVEALFDNLPDELQSYFELNDLDFEKQLILRREISSNGKSRAFINDTPVNLSVMRELADQLVDMHSQHESQELSSSQFQITLLDSLARQEPTVRNYKTLFNEYQSRLHRYDELLQLHIQETNELDYLNFQLNEITSASLKEDEQHLLEKEMKQLENAEVIRQSFSAAWQVLMESEYAVMQQLKGAIALIHGIQKFYLEAGILSERLESSRIELADICDEIENHQERLNPDPEKLQWINQRLDLIYRLQSKHRTNSIKALLDVSDQLYQKISTISIHTDELDSLEKVIASGKKVLAALAEKISQARKKQIPVVTEEVNRMLKNVGMNHAQIKIETEQNDSGELNAYGMDHFRFLFSSNKGSIFQELRKVASGGELSRLMLCIKSLVASSTSLPTLIFDEIDTGISGETAMKVSAILKQLALQHQVICITHLPQIAAKGDVHYFVYKELSGGRTQTQVRSLNPQEKIKAIAEMISGEKVTSAALESAKELLN